MPRKALWTAIHDTLAADIRGGRYAPGAKLPTEAELTTRFSVNRHTVRRALSALAEQNLVRSRRGAGVFVQHASTDYPIGSRVRFHQNIMAAGRTPERSFVLLETRAADAKEAAALSLKQGAPVHVCEGLSLVDSVPLALFRSVFPAGRFPQLLDHLRQDGSVTAALQAFGVLDYTRKETRVDGKVASVSLAAQLQIEAGAPILRTTGVNVDADGAPLEYGRTWFAADRTTLVLGQVPSEHSS